MFYSILDKSPRLPTESLTPSTPGFISWSNYEIIASLSSFIKGEKAFGGSTRRPCASPYKNRAPYYKSIFSFYLKNAN